jgi:hypothetical protein
MNSNQKSQARRGYEAPRDAQRCFMLLCWWTQQALSATDERGEYDEERVQLLQPTSLGPLSDTVDGGSASDATATAAAAAAAAAAATATATKHIAQSFWPVHVMRGMAFLVRACEQSAVDGSMGGGMGGGMGGEMGGGVGGGLMALDGMDLWLCHMIAHHTRHGQHDLHEHQRQHHPQPMSTEACVDASVESEMEVEVEVEVDAGVAGLDVALLMISASSVQPNDVRALAQSIQDLLSHALGGGRDRQRDRHRDSDRDSASNSVLQTGSVCVNLLTLLTSPVRDLIKILCIQRAIKI